jgi:hypothetical protein
MNRLRVAYMPSLILLFFFAVLASAQAQTGTLRTCENLKGTVDKYLAAPAAHSPSGLAIDPKVNFTENGVELKVGEGLRGFKELKGFASLTI